MILVPGAIQKQVAEIVRAMHSGTVSEVEGAQQIQSLDPGHFLPYLFLGQAEAAAGNLDAAEALYWQGLERGPCTYSFYMGLGDVRGKRDAEDPLAAAMKTLALIKMVLAGDLGDDVAERLRSSFEGSPLDFKNPEDLELLAGVLEASRKEKPEPAEVADRLRPYRIFHDLQRQAPNAVRDDVLERLRENADSCVPILGAALGEWSRLARNLSPEALRLVVALLGELGSADILHDLLELTAWDDDALFLHAQWAIRRIGQRFPSEALAKLREAIPTAPLSLRCGIAEQLGLLPESVDVFPAAGELLQGFSDFTEHGDAAYLLMAVTNSLGDRGQRAEGLALLARYQGLLPAEDRKWLLEGRADFVPNLVREEIDQLDIEDVVLNRAYMEDEDDYEDEEEEEDEPVRRPVKPGRNDPCWCGSGKKYKKCHLVSDEEAERSAARAEPRQARGTKEAPEPPPGDPLYRKVFEDVIGASQDWISRKEFLRANRLYFDQHPGDVDSEAASAGGFFEWYVYDFRPANTGRTAVEEYLKRHGPRLPARERALLDSWRAARYGLFEVQRADEGSGVELEDVLAGGRFFVNDVSASRELVRWDCVMNRVEEFEGRWLFGGNGILVPRQLLPELRRFIEEESRKTKQAPADFVRANSHFWHRFIRDLHEDRMEGLQMVNAEGEPIEICVATYRVRDEDAAVAALAGIEGMEETTSPGDAAGGRHFGWMETGAEGPRRSYGHIEMRNGRLRLECNSRGRMERGRRLLEAGAGRFLEHLGDSIESAQAAMRRVKREGPPEKKPAPIPPEVMRDVVLKHKTEHYATWADTPLPALQGKTPREAMATESGHRDVEDLIRMMENGEERERKNGKPAFDFSPIREELGLPHS